MNYELCKSLKDAGFPQENTGYCCYYIYTDRYGYLESVGDQPQEGFIRKPSLSELIEACAEDEQTFNLFNGYLIGKEGMWHASSTYIVHPEHGGSLICHGSTPEEAVARLWLELNKK